MRSGAIIYPLLLASAGVDAIVGSKIYAVRAVQTTEPPYIVYREISSTPTNTKGVSSDITADPRVNQRSILDITTVQISCFAPTYARVEDLAVQVRSALDREWGTATGSFSSDIYLDSCVYDSCLDDYDDDYGDVGIYIKHLDFTLRIARLDID
mgnify:FL=1|tara:strand:+ start:2214 stop:2675 length:462 start_codon:yes stop_codon:yes gene_type:complete